MLLLLSPSKTLDFESEVSTSTYTLPEFLPESVKLIKILRDYSPAKLSRLMDISDKLAALNVSRYQDFSTPFTPANARQAIFAFKGDVYAPIEVESFQAKQLDYAQKHVHILSGLYGVLRPLDLIQPYRLEMGIRLPNSRGKDLYTFWGERITKAVNQAASIHKGRCIVNLASEEYFSAVQPDRLDGKLIHIVFKERQKGALKIIGLFAKKARGMMVNFAIKNRISAVDKLQTFCEGGYAFDPALSDEQHWVFVR